MENFGREESFAQNKLHIPDRIRIDLYCKSLYKQNSIKEQNLYGRSLDARLDECFCLNTYFLI